MNFNRDKILRDFSQFKGRILAILLFGSTLTGEQHVRSDIDICLVAPASNPDELFKEILKMDVTERYDVKIFELLPLGLKGRILEDHIVVWTRDKYELSYYLYKWKKIWLDQKLSLRKLGFEIYS